MAAKQLMTVRDLPLSEIAISAGFANQSHLREFFQPRLALAQGFGAAKRSAYPKGIDDPDQCYQAVSNPRRLVPNERRRRRLPHGRWMGKACERPPEVKAEPPADQASPVQRRFANEMVLAAWRAAKISSGGCPIPSARFAGSNMNASHTSFGSIPVMTIVPSRTVHDGPRQAIGSSRPWWGRRDGRVAP